MNFLKKQPPIRVLAGIAALLLISVLALNVVSAFQQDTFDRAYWAAQPPQVRALQSMPPDTPERIQKAIELAQAGYLIDKEIMAIGLTSPYSTMRLREINGGYPWVPSLLQPPGIGTDHPLFMMAPGAYAPGVQPFPTTRPPGTITVSSKVEDYPPYDPPAPPPVVTAKSMVGPVMIGSYYHSGPGDSQDVPAGAVWEDERGKFVKETFANPFGASVRWVKQ